jgi:hypothetical protein
MTFYQAGVSVEKDYIDRRGRYRLGNRRFGVVRHEISGIVV